MLYYLTYILYIFDVYSVKFYNQVTDYKKQFEK